MSWEPPAYTDEEIIAHIALRAAHWEAVALDSPPDVAFHCVDYAKHLRTIAKCLRMDLLEKALEMREHLGD